MKLTWQYGILFICTAGAEACWLFALLSLLNKLPVNESISVIILLLLFPLAFVTNKLIRLLKWSRFFTLSFSWLICIILTFILVKIQVFNDMNWLNPTWILASLQSIPQIIYTFKPELLILISSPFLWWLGQRLIHQRFNFTLSLAEFQFGLIIIVITLAIAAASKIELTGAIPVTATFFIFALAGISISHAQEDNNWISEIYKSHWIWLLITSIGLILIIGFLIGILVSPNLLQLIIAALKWIWELILKFIAFLGSLLPKPEAGEMPAIPPMPDIGSGTKDFKLWTMPETLRKYLNIGMAVMWAGLILAALWQISSQIFKWLHIKFNSSEGIETESLSGAFKADIIRLMKGIVAMLLRLVRRFRIFKKPISGHPEVASVRQLYRNLLHWAAKSGYPRYTFQTPYDYLNKLTNLLPDARQDLNFVTEQYVSTRYGKFIPNASELQQINQSWYRIKQNQFNKSSEIDKNLEVGQNGK